MIIRLSLLGAGAGNVDVVQVVPAKTTITMISISSSITIAAASLGGFAVPSFLFSGSIDATYGVNRGFIDNCMIAAAMNYITQGTANGNYPSTFEKLLPGLSIKLPAGGLLGLRTVGAANATFSTEAILYCK